MPYTADTLLAVRRSPTSRRVGKVRLGDLHSIQWRSQAGGTRSRFMSQPFVFGRMLCTQIVEGRIAHSCQHGPPPHQVLVCMCQKDNPKPLAAFIGHLANLEGALSRLIRERGAAHWLSVIDELLAMHPLPASWTRNQAGRGGKTVSQFAKRNKTKRRRKNAKRYRQSSAGRATVATGPVAAPQQPASKQASK